MKKKISMFLAVVMIVTLLPAMGVFAVTSHEVSNYPALPKDYDLSDPSVTNTPPPYLIIKGNSSTEVDATKAVFRLTLDNAEWSLKGQNFLNVAEDNGDNKYGFEGAKTESTYGSNSELNYYIERLSSTMVQVVLRGDASLSDPDFYENGTIAGVDTTKFQNDDRIRIPLFVKTKSEGVATVTISGGGTDGISNSAALPFASVGGGKTNAYIGKVTDFADMADLETLVIDELILGTIEAGKTLKLSLPNGFEFVNPGSISSRTTGGLGGDLGTGKYGTYGKSSSGTNDDRSIVEFEKIPITESTTREGAIILDNIRIVAEDDDAKKGEVELTISGAGTTKQSIVVANYVSYDISLEAEDEELPVLVSGRYPENPDDEEIETLEVTFKELTADTWSSRKRTTFTFPDGVKPRAVEIKSDKMNPDKDNENIDKLMENNDDGETWDGNGIWKLDDDGLTIRQANIEQGEKAKIEMTFYLSIEPGFEGDIDVTVGNEGVGRESSATIATAVSPFTVETTSIQYPIGAKELEVNDVIIKETVAGAIQKTGANTYSSETSDTLKIWIEDMPIETNSSKVEVTDGDMNIEKVNFRSNGIELTIKRASSTPSTIKITDTLTRINRDLPRGDYQLRIGGSVVANYSDATKLKEATFDKDYYVAYPDYVVVTTDVGYQDAAFNKSVKVTIGSTEIVSGDDIITADVAPFIENGSTYVPLAATAEALGMNTDRDIIWNAIDKSVMVFTTNRTARMVANSNVITINGVDTPINSPVLIRDNRTFLPFRVLGEQVLGVPVDWDETTRTASYN